MIFRWDNHNHQLTDLDVTDTSTLGPKDHCTEINENCKEDIAPLEVSACPTVSSPFIGFGGPNTSSRPTARTGGNFYGFMWNCN